MPLVIVILDWLAVTLRLSSWFGWAAFRSLAIAAGNRLKTIGGITLATAISSLFTALVTELDEWRDELVAFILQKSGIEIAAEDLLDQEAWKVAAGKRGAELINEAIGTELTTIYPPDNLKAELSQQVQTDLINGGGLILSSEAVQQFRNQVDETLALAQGLAGSAIVPIELTDGLSLKKRKKRNNNRAYQRQYRATHERLQLWIEPDLVAAVDAFKQQVRDIIEAREP